MEYTFKEHKKVSDFFDIEDCTPAEMNTRINKHNDNAYKQLDLCILDFFKFVESVCEEEYDISRKYEISEDDKDDGELVKLVKYAKREAITEVFQKIKGRFADRLHYCELLEEDNQ